MSADRTALPAAQRPSTAVAPLRANRNFRVFWLGETISQFGDRISELALPLIAVTMLGANAGQVGILTAAIWLPNVLALVVGAWVDRQGRKRRLLIVADLARAAILVSLPIAYLMGSVGLGQLYLIGILTGCGQVLFSMAYQSCYVALVPPESYVEANSRLSFSRAVSFVVGPVIGGVLVQGLSAPMAILVDVASFVLSAILLRRITGPEPMVARDGPPMLALVREGLTLVWRNRVLRAALGCTATVNFFTYIASALLVLYASRELGLSAGAIGIAFGVGALGAVAGSALGPWVSRHIGVGRAAIIGSALFPAPLAAAAFAHGSAVQKVCWLAAVELLSSIGVMLMDINLNAILTQATQDDARGRRAGAYSAVNYGVRPLGALMGGFLGTSIGLRPSLLVAGVGGVLAVIWLLASPVRTITGLADPL